MINESRTFASHLPALEAVFMCQKIRSVYEFGMGFASTAFFLVNLKGGRLVSVEMDHVAWFERVCRAYKEWGNFEPLLHLGAHGAVELLKRSITAFGLIFVDGHGERWRGINAAFKETGIVVAHDTEASCYAWDRVAVPLGWEAVIWDTAGPWTTIWSNDKEFLQRMRIKKRAVQTHRSY